MQYIGIPHPLQVFASEKRVVEASGVIKHFGLKHLRERLAPAAGCEGGIPFIANHASRIQGCFEPGSMSSDHATPVAAQQGRQLQTVVVLPAGIKRAITHIPCIIGYDDIDRQSSRQEKMRTGQRVVSKSGDIYMISALTKRDRI